MLGKTISHYKILEKLGEGGMGVVYKAQDTKLDRIVALKFLPKHLLCDESAKTRFEHEAKAASALNHPNITTIYEIDEVEGECFICMEYVEGTSLKEMIKKKTLSLKEIIDIAIQMAEGLSKAHEKGIVHRDVKPANIFVTADGAVKILDFGLAKLAGSQTKLTKTGMTLGTVAYMSPEQAKGEEVDHKTDIWSLGVVLYEMLTGQLPFGAEYEQAVVYSILNEQPRAIDLIRKDIPKNLQDIVYKSMEKNSALRYQNMNEVVKELKEAKIGSVKPKKEKSILVLPFDDISPGKDNEYFSDGLTEELITDLSQIHTLRVISRTSSMMLKGTKKNLRTIAREVNVQYVLEGSVRKVGNDLRISAQLIDATSDVHLWAQKFIGTLDDVFDIQEKASRSIVDALKLKLTPEEMERMIERPIPNALTYEFYLKARQEMFKFTEAGLENALRYLQNGLGIVGQNALLYAGLAYVFCQYINLGIKEEEYCRKEAEGYINKAFALEPLSSYANLVQGLLQFFDNPREGLKHLKRVLETNPNDFDALFWLSCLYGSLGKTLAVIPFEEKTIRIDPLNPAAHFHSGFNRIWEGKFASALELLGKLNQSFPEDLLIKWAYALSLAYMNERDQACLLFEQVAREQPGTFLSDISLSLKYALEGKKSEALRCINSNQKLKIRRDFQLAYQIAECYSLVDEKEEALNSLERAIDLGMINYPFMNEYDPFLENIRGEERFKKLMERVKYEWEHFEV